MPKTRYIKLTTPIVQKTYNVGVTKPDVGQTSVYNKLEDSVENISPDMAILTGTLGEQWPVKLSKIFKKYDISEQQYEALSNGESIAVSTKSVPQNVPTNFAFCIPTDISCVVTTEDGQGLNVNQEYNRNNEQISHGQGDLIVCGAKQLDNGDFVPDTEWGFWVVNGAVAENTYELLGKEYALEDVVIGEVGNDILEGDSVSIKPEENTPSQAMEDIDIGEEI